MPLLDQVQINNFWLNLPRPILALAPMEEVTDTVFRRIVAECGRPSLMYTEFTSVEGINSIGGKKVAHRLNFTDSERPLVAQIWGLTPENYFKSAVRIREMGFDGVDLNMGCPVKKVIKMGACSALIKNPNLAKEIVLATKEGAGNLPVSIKTRIGFHEIQTEEWIGFLLRECRPAAIAVHGRTVKEESKVPNHWDEIARAVVLRNTLGVDTLILGNGDIQDLSEAKEKVKLYGLDGVMVGRAIFKNPWFFNSEIDPDQVKISTRLDLLRKHLSLYQAELTGHKNYNELKRFFKIYITGYAGSAEFRAKLMQTISPESALALLEDYYSRLNF